MITLVMTVLNEAKTIGALLEDIAAQTHIPDQVIIVDAGSTDGTISRIRDYKNRGLPIELIIEVGANRSRGRNIGIARARHPIIAVTDGGVRLHPEWTANITHPLLQDTAVDVVSGMTRSMARTLTQHCFASIVIHNTRELHNPAWLERLYYRFIYRRRFNSTLPSSRSIAFRKEIWERAGGYPEELEVSEDMLFNLRLRKAGAQFTMAPGAIVYWTLKKSAWANFTDFYQRAKYDGMARIFLGRSFTKLTVYVGAMALLILCFLLSPLFLVPLALGFGLYALQPALVALRETRRVPSVFLTAFLLFGKDLSQNIGFVSGYIQSLRATKRIAKWTPV